MRLNRPQTLANRAFTDGSTVVLAWGRGVGKTEFILASEFLLVAACDGTWRRPLHANPVQGVRIAYLLPATTQAKKTVLERFIGKLRGQFGFLGGTINLVDLRVTFPGGSWIQFVSQEQRELIRGLRVDAIFVDEADDIEPEFFSAVAAPWLSEPHSLRRTMMGGTPTRGRYGLLYQRYRFGREGTEGHRSVHATYRDAPEHVSAELVERERKLAEQSGTLATFEREWECNFDAAEGLVYPIFTPDIHAREAPRDTVWTEFLVGVDHGWEDPGVILLIGVSGHGRDATAWVLSEVYQNRREHDWWRDQARAVVKRTAGVKARWFIDPSRPDTIESFRRIGAVMGPVDNSIEPGTAAVANKLAVRETGDGVKFARLYVSPTCTNTIREFGLYRRKRDRANKDRILDDIEDKNNHAMDALRYAISGRFVGPDNRATEYSDGSFGFG